MNICLLSLEWPPYGCGIATYMFNLARGLTTLGHNVTVITNDKGPLPCAGVKIVPVSLPDIKRTFWRKVQRWRMEPYYTWSLTAYKKFLAICNRQQFDIVETAEFGAWARHLVGRMNVPLVVRCHNPTHVVWAVNQTANDSCRMPLWLRFQDKWERWQTFHADTIVCPSFALANHISLSWVIPRKRFNILPNPIDAELFCAGETDEKEKKEILYAGRLQYNKGGFDLAESVKPLLERYPGLTIRLIGMDAEAPKRFKRYGNMASEAILSLIPRRCHSRVLFTNHVPVSDIISFQQRAICAVMPTRGFESFSYTVLEAMACRTAVVATHCGGPTEIITDGFDGLLVPPGDTKALTEAMERLISNPELRDKLASQARRTVEQRFATPVVVPQIIRLYENAISSYRNRPL